MAAPPPRDSCYEITRLSRKKTRSLDERPKTMNTEWMNEQFVLDFYQSFLTLLVWVLASFACLGLVASLALLFVDRAPQGTGTCTLPIENRGKAGSI